MALKNCSGCGSARPKTWFFQSLILVLASLVLLTIWSLPFAVTSLYYAVKVDGKWRAKDIDGAILASQKAYKFYKIGLWVGIGIWLVIIILFLLFLIFGAIYNRFG